MQTRLERLRQYNDAMIWEGMCKLLNKGKNRLWTYLNNWDESELIDAMLAFVEDTEK